MKALLVSLFGTLIFTGGPKMGAEPKVPVCAEVQQIGALPLTVQVGATQVRFTEWMAKDADVQEMIGFRAASTGPVSFVVRAGSESFEGEGTQWQNPRGVVGPAVKGIERLTICAPQ